MASYGVIGTGSMGQNHARVYAEMRELAAVADADKKRAAEIAGKSGAKSFSDYKELISQKSIEAVSIATPTASHYEVAKYALESGKHVLLEKPMCKTSEQARKLIDLAHEQGLVLAIGHIERHNPIVMFTKDQVGRGKFGRVITIASRRVSSFPARIRDVGVIFDLGIHDIDVQRYLVGSDIESVYALANREDTGSKTTFETCASMLLRFKNGISGFIEVNWLTPMRVRKMALTCSHNFVEMDYMTQSLQISSSASMDFEEGNLFKIPQNYEINRVSLSIQEPLKNEILDFIGAIKNKRKPFVTGEDGLRALQAADAAVLSCTEGKVVQLQD